MNDSASKTESHFPRKSPAAADSGQSNDGHKKSGLSIDQPTIVTNSPPIPCPAAADSGVRILEGRVMPGDRIEHFELVEYVGGGGMGRVFRAVDTKLGRTVALKILPPEQATDPDAFQRFQNEAQSAARLDHENIARVYYVGEDGDLSYIVSEFIEGENLKALVERRGPLPLTEAISYTLQVAEALAHADSRKIVHRDIKPSNVLVTPEGCVKLIDLGLARLQRPKSDGDDLTASGVTLGTFDYISPEQARDPRHADIRSDIYSLGCTLFFMLSGRPPFPEGTVLQKLLQHQGDRPPDILQFRPELPDELKQVLEKMMEKSPERRYADCGELASDLLVLADRIGLQPMIPTSRIWLKPPPAPTSSLGRHLPWMVPVLSLLCAVLLLDWLWSRQDDYGQPPIEIAKTDPATPTATPEPSASPSPDATAKETPVENMTIDLFDKDPLYTPNEWNIYEPDFLSDFEQPAKTPDTKTGRESPVNGSQPTNEPSENTPAGQHDDSPPSSDDKDPATAAGATNEPASQPSDVLIVSDSASAENEYASLGAALASANDGDVIELHFNGPREERPIKLSNSQVTVRPGKGFKPRIIFRPDEINPVIYPRSMLTLSAGRLTLIDVAIELRVPRDLPADTWSLFETWGGQSLRLERCSLTVRNASDQLMTYHPDVSFISARPAPDAGTSVEGAPAATPLASIELVDSIARGEAVFLRVDELQPVHLLWDNGLLVTTDALLSAGGGQVAPKPDETLRIELRRLTAIVRGGLCRLTSTPSNPYQLTVQFVCTDDIFAAVPGVPLVEQDGVVSLEQSRQRFVWNGNRNHYQDVEVFWVVRNIDPDVPPESMSFETWKSHWGPSRENQPDRSPLAWKKYPSTDRPLHTHTPTDYTLDYPAYDSGPDGGPGSRIDRLPAPSADPPTKRPAPSGYFRGEGTPRRSGKY